MPCGNRKWHKFRHKQLTSNLMQTKCLFLALAKRLFSRERNGDIWHSLVYGRTVSIGLNKRRASSPGLEAIGAGPTQTGIRNKKGTIKHSEPESSLYSKNNGKKNTAFLPRFVYLSVKMVKRRWNTPPDLLQTMEVRAMCNQLKCMPSLITHSLLTCPLWFHLHCTLCLLRWPVLNCECKEAVFK